MIYSSVVRLVLVSIMVGGLGIGVMLKLVVRLLIFIVWLLLRKCSCVNLMFWVK